MARLSLLVVLALGCQEYSLDTDKPPSGDPPDTDPAVDALQPDIEVTPPQLRFGSLPPGCAADDQTLTVTNVGEAPLLIDSISLAGPGNAAYTLDAGDTDTSAELDPGDSLMLTVGFQAADFIPYDRAKVRVLSNDPDEAQHDTPLAGEGSQASFREDLFIQEQATAVDVLFVIDTSSSMSDQINDLGGAMSSFAQSFVNLGLDWQIGVTTTDMTAMGAQGRLLGPVIDASTANPVATFRNQTDQGIEGSVEEKGFAASQAALSAPLIDNENRGLMRPDATIAVAVVSDEDDAGANPAGGSGNPSVTNAYVNFLKSLKSDPGDVSFSGLVGPQSGGLVACPGGILAPSASQAPQYHKAIRDTDGVWSNICDWDIDPFLQHLSYVAAGLEFRFPLTDTPLNTGPTAITVEVDGQTVPYGPADGWTYDAVTNSIVLNGDTIPDPGESIVVTYPYDAGC